MIDPRRSALAAQILIAAQTVLLLVYGVTGGTRSRFFALSLPASGPLFIATIVVFLVWFRRCRINAEAFAPGTHQYSIGFSVGAWFVPLAMWWSPRRIALGIWRASGATGGEGLVNAWWAAWLTKTVVAATAFQLVAHPDPFSVLPEAANIAAAVLAILVIRRITAAQSARLGALDSDRVVVGVGEVAAQ